MNIRQMLSGSDYIVLPRFLINHLGSISKAILFSELCALYDKHGEWFFHKQEDLCERTCLSLGTIKKSLAELKKDGYIQIQRKGIPAKSYYNVTNKIEQLYTNKRDKDNANKLDQSCTNWIDQSYTNSVDQNCTNIKSNNINKKINNNNIYIEKNKKSDFSEVENLANTETPSNPTSNLTNEKEKSCAKKEKAKTAVFKTPTVEEVQEYCQERNNGLNAAQFVDYYISNGWMIGKAKMKDWKATVRNWERNNTKTNSTIQTPQKAPQYDEL